MRTLLAILVLVGVACSDSARTQGATRSYEEAVSVRDSSGVLVRMDSRGLEDLPIAHRFSEEASVVLGLDESVDAELFVEIGDIVSHPDFGIAVADAKALDIRLFDWSGTHRLTLGGPGDGPGEFVSVRALEGDSTLWAWDWDRGRITRFDWSGAVLSDMSPGRAGMPWGGITTFTGSGYVVLGRHLLHLPSDDLGFQFRQDSIELRIVDPAGDTIASLGRIPATEWVFHSLEFIGGPPGARISTNFVRPLGRVQFVGTLADKVILGRGDIAEFSVHSTDASLTEIWRFPGLVRPVTTSSLDQWTTKRRERLLAQGNTFESRTLVPDFVAEFPPTTFPAFVDVVVSDAGELWLATPTTSELRTWVVVSQEGELLGRAELSADLDVRAISERGVIAVVTGPLGIQQVRIYDRLSTTQLGFAADAIIG